MIKNLFIFLIVVFVLFISYQNWDILFSESQHIFYRLYYSYSVHSNSGSLIEKREIPSLLLKTTMKVNIYLPIKYYSESKRKYPVLFLLHGYPGTNNDWLINTNLQQRLDERINSGKLPPLIVIFPDMNGPVIRDSQYLDATKIDQKMESYFVTELIPYIDDNYRTTKSRSNRAIGGLSSGGYGALYLGLKYNSLFSYIFSHSGYMINKEPVLNQLITHVDKNRDKYSPLLLIDTLALKKPIFIYFDIGKNDNRSFIKDNYAFNEKLHKLNISHLMKLTEGKHGWNVWGRNIENSLEYLNVIDVK